MNIDEAHRGMHTSVGGGHVHVSSPLESEIITVAVGADTVRLSGINEAIAVADLLNRTVAHARRVAHASEED